METFYQRVSQFNCEIQRVIWHSYGMKSLDVPGNVCLSIAMLNYLKQNKNVDLIKQ